MMGRIHDTFLPNIVYVSSAMKQTYLNLRVKQTDILVFRTDFNGHFSPGL